MRVILLRPEQASAEDAALWAYYGATQAFKMLGLPFEEQSLGPGPSPPFPPNSPCPLRQEDVSSMPYLLVDAAQGEIGLNCWRKEEQERRLPAAELPTIVHEALYWDEATGQTVSLPLLGPLRQPMPGRPLGKIIPASAETESLPLLTIAETKDAVRLYFTGHVFETIGLYLSRFSWPGNPGWRGFVREIDTLWEEELRERWGRQAVVADYLSLLADLLCWLHAQAKEPLLTIWPQPYRDGEIKRVGFLVTHDVDQLFPDPAWRTKLDQSANPRFFLPRWRDFERSLGVRSAFYFFCPKPGENYWQTPNYSLADPPVRREAEILLREGWEVSLHLLSYERPEAIQGEVETLLSLLPLEHPTGTRSHYLKHTFHTLAYKAAAGLRYDSSWYAEQSTSSLLCGTLWPFRPLDCQTGAPVALWEFPFVVEDGIVFGVYGEGTARDIAGAIADGQLLIDVAIRYEGYVCFNWHQRTFSQMSAYPGAPDCWPPALAGLIASLRSKASGIWQPLPGELADWLTRREQISLFNGGGEIWLYNDSPEDCPDLVLCMHLWRGQSKEARRGARNLPPGVQALAPQGARERYGRPLALAAGQKLQLCWEEMLPAD